jgi:hypothetical protein
LGAVAALAMFGCNAGGGSQLVLPALATIRVSSTLAVRSRTLITVHADRRRSWMASDAKSTALLYVSNDGNDLVYVYSYPHAKLKGYLSDFNEPQGECVDAADDVWITNTNDSDVLEFAHGGTSPITTLSDPNEYPVGCSIDPTTGNLAVTNIFGAGTTQGNVSVYSGASGKPTTYTDPEIYFMYFCGYDDKGNLFVDGRNTSGAFQFAELPKNGKNLFKNITLNYTVEFPGGVQWDGKHVAVGDQGEGGGSMIYQTTGAGGKVVSATPLSGSCDVVQFSIQNTKVVGPDYCNNEAGIWKYRAGGPVTKVLAGEGEPIGSVVSE